MSKRSTFLSSFLFGFLGVSIGAFGAHFLKGVLLDNQLTHTFETGIQYHLIHALALFGTAHLMTIINTAQVKYAAFCFTTGIVLFSFSLYIMSITQIKALGVITPIGGLFFLSGWALLFYAVLKSSIFTKDK